MHSEIFKKNQKELFPVMSLFRKEYYLVGGTAIALYIGHRRSIDFDMFKYSTVNHKKNIDKIQSAGFSYLITRRVEEQMNLIVNDVKLTFFQYPFPVKPTENFENIFRLPSLLQLAAMKAYALGRRSKWKDYVDLYFIISNYFSIKEIANMAYNLFGDLFSEKMFRAQLCFFEDIDYTEEVDWLIPEPPTNEVIQMALTDFSLQGI